jgi:amino acid adenylation domain-containing protein
MNNNFSKSTRCETVVGDSSTHCLHHLFEAQAACTPTAVAIVWDQQQITYDALNRHANQLAHTLCTVGIGPDTPVGLCFDRSLEMVIALLAIMKAGGCYVPLDPVYPTERLALMIQTADLRLLLTNQNLWTQLPELANVVQLPTVLCVDQMWATITQASVENLDTAVYPEHLLYLLFTSGSTGTPKGVAMPHRALVNLLQWQQAQMPTAVGERTLQFTPLSFDVATQEIFATLCFGGTLVLVADAIRRNPQALCRFLQAEAIHRLFLPFVALQQVAEAARGQRPTALRTVVTAGEQLQITPAIAQFFRPSAADQPICTLHNHYGPTESHVVTAYTLPADVDHWSPLPSIGRPVTNVQVYLLNEAQETVPVGEIGELYLGGVCLARGYYQRPDLTEERFIDNPFGSGKLYKTGDLARYLADGNLDYIGRSDQQVKIRGFRVELGEIEVALARHPQVQAAVVLLREDRPGLKQLVAYVVPQENMPQTAASLFADLRDALRQTLPEYMLPAHIVRLDALPLTPSGKVDRRGLPKPEAKRPDLKTVLRLPRTATESKLAEAWQDLLQIDTVGIDDNFFELGGTSLLLTQLHARLVEEFPKLETVDLLQYPTVHTLAEHLQRTLATSTAKENQSTLSPTRRLDRQASALDRREQRLRHRVA